MFREIQSELKRLAAEDIAVSVDGEFAPDVGTLVKVEYQEAIWRLIPGEFLGLLEELPTGAGASSVQQHIEQSGQFVWHGPSPSGIRDHGEPSPPEGDGP
jgi:hypothetical protein